MDQRERYDDPAETIRIAMRSLQSRLWTALPCYVESFDAQAMTVVAIPFIAGRALQLDGTLEDLPIPPLGDVPVVYPGGGGATLTFPIEPGDECLVVFASRCIDMWWKYGKVAPPAEGRMHSLSDGFALVGVRSQPNVLANISTTATQLRSNDGSTLIALNPTAQSIAITAPGGVTINGVTIDSSGNVTAPGDVKGEGTSLHTHVHTDPQGGDTGVPV